MRTSKTKPRSKSPRSSRTTSKKPPRLKSKFEKRFYDELTKRGLEFAYEAESLPYILELSYKPDWKVDDTLFLETKGKFDYTERRKLLAVQKANPGKEVRMVFMRNQKLGKGSKMTYGEWCDKHGIRWSVFPELPL
jgi:Phage endonuclease I